MLFLVLSRFKFSEVALWFSQNSSLRKRTLLWFNEALFLGHVTKATHSNTPAAQREAEENDAGIGFFLGSVVLGGRCSVVWGCFAGVGRSVGQSAGRSVGRSGGRSDGRRVGGAFLCSAVLERNQWPIGSSQ